MNIVRLPVNDVAELPRGLRALADDVEKGAYGDAHALAWIIDCGAGRVEIGMLGRTTEPGAVAHFLFALAQRKLEAVT